jgi:hypothetical protein
MVFRPGVFQQPLPRLYETSFWCEADYKIPIATASLTGGTVKLNSTWLPFRPGGSSAFPSYTFLGPASESTLQPTGYSTLVAGNLYSQYKVLRSSIQIRWSGSNSGNNVTCTLVPASNVASIASIYQARTMPYAKQATFAVSKPNTGVNGGGWLTHSVDPQTVIGFTPLESKADVFSNVGGVSGDPPITMWWWIFFQSNDLDVSATTASLLQIRLHQRVQLMSLTAMPQT